MVSKAARITAERRTAIAEKQRDLAWNYVTHIATKKLEEITAHSNLFSKGQLDAVPKFGVEELRMGSVVQRGVFGTVREIRDIQCKTDSGKLMAPEADNDSKDLELQGKKFIADHCILDGGDACYCIKALTPDLIANRDRFTAAVINMAVETMILSVVSHPHILPMRAFKDNGMLRPDHFIVLDRLYDTLQARIHKWRSQSRRQAKSVMKSTKRTSAKHLKALLETKLRYAYDLSGALEYLHASKLLHRNLKPENAGFNYRGDIVLCNFGLARDVPDRSKVTDNTWKLTGETGSLRYMAPEVASNKPYGYSADVYSFGIMLWEMLAMAQPFEGFSKQMHSEWVVRRGMRLKTEVAWGPSLIGFLTSCWHADANERPTAAQAVNILKKEAANMSDREGEGGGLELSKRVTPLLGSIKESVQRALFVL